MVAVPVEVVSAAAVAEPSVTFKLSAGVSTFIEAATASATLVAPPAVSAAPDAAKVLGTPVLTDTPLMTKSVVAAERPLKVMLSDKAFAAVLLDAKPQVETCTFEGAVAIRSTL